MVVHTVKEENMVKKQYASASRRQCRPSGWAPYMGEHAAQRQQEVAALRAGIDHGLTVIDTAENVRRRRAEEVVGQRSAVCATG